MLENRPRILHVTEAMAGGIVTVLQSFAERQTESGADVTIYYLSRPDSPTPVDLQGRFKDIAHLRTFTNGGSKLRDYLALSMEVARVNNSAEFDVIHLHSSKAGALGRLVRLFTRRRTKVFYSPHGFAFLREDISWAMRKTVQLAELAMAPLGHGLILTCPSEQRIAEQALRSKKTFRVTTGVDEKTIVPSHGECLRTPLEPSAKLPTRPKVGIVARVTYQKAPWRFKVVADALSEHADFIWVGSGTPDQEALWLGEHQTTGWLSPGELSKAIEELDVFLFPTLWEGMPLALLQAQAAGIPAVVSNVVGNRDAVVDGETGYVCDSNEELIMRTKQLIEDSDLRRRMSVASSERAYKHLTDRDLGVQSLAIYRGHQEN